MPSVLLQVPVRSDSFSYLSQAVCAQSLLPYNLVLLEFDVLFQLRYVPLNLSYVSILVAQLLFITSDKILSLRVVFRSLLPVALLLKLTFYSVMLLSQFCNLALMGDYVDLDNLYVRLLDSEKLWFQLDGDFVR